MAEKVGAEHYGEERQETSEGKAEAIVRAELKRRGWTDKTLKARAKGDKDKVRMAGRLRRETTMTLAWIAVRLRMGTKTHLSHLLYWQKRVNTENRHLEVGPAIPKQQEQDNERPHSRTGAAWLTARRRRLPSDAESRSG